MKAITNLLAAIFVTVSSQAQFSSSETIKTYPSLPPLIDAEVHDLNGDGQLEIIGVTRNKLVVFQNQGSFQFTPEVIAQLPSGQIQDLAKVNLNAAGQPEFVITSDSNNPRVFSIGQGNLIDQGNLSLGTGEHSGQQTYGFVNDDELPDLLLSQESGIAVFFNEAGTGDFSFEYDIPYSDAGIALGDLTGDGLDDLCVATGNNLFYHENISGSLTMAPTVSLFTATFDGGSSGAFNFWEETTIKDRRVEIKDLNGDDELDIFHSVAFESGKLYWDEWPNRRSLNISSRGYVMRNKAEWPEDDSYNLVSDLSASLNSFDFSNVPSFAPPFLSELDDISIPEKYYHTAADLNDDGTMEGVLVIPGSIYIQGVEQRINALDFYGEVFFADLDNSGEVEMVMLAEEGISGFLKNINSIQDLADAMNSFVALESQEFSPSAQAVSTIDGVTKHVVVENSALQNRLRIIDYQGYPEISEETFSWKRKEQTLTNLRSGDVNGDGFDDLILIHRQVFDERRFNYALSYLPGTGNGFSQPQNISGIITTDTRSSVLMEGEDLDGDGDADIVLCDCIGVSGSGIAGYEVPTCAVKVYLNDATFQSVPDHELIDEGVAEGLFIDDFNGDGELEIMVQFTELPPRLYTTDLTLITELDESTDLAQVRVGDYNSDGISDIFFSNRVDVAGVYLGQGSSEYAAPIIFDVPGAFLQFANVHPNPGLELINDGSVYAIIDDEAVEVSSFAVDSAETKSFTSGILSDEEFEDLVQITNSEEPSVNFFKNVNGETGEILLIVYEDVNGNGLRESGEEGISFISIAYENESADQSGLAFTNNEGEVNLEVIAVDEIQFSVSFDEDVWTLTTDNSPITLSGSEPPEFIEFGLQTTGSGIWNPNASANESTVSESQAKDGASNFILSENNGITDNNYVFIEDEYSYSWTFTNTTGSEIESLFFESSVPGELNWETFLPVSSSHSMNVVIDNTQGLTNLEVGSSSVNLPDSENGPGSYSFSYQIQAYQDQPHLQPVLNEITANWDEGNSTQSNLTENKVYTCQGLEETVSFDFIQPCSPAELVFSEYADEPPVDFELLLGEESFTENDLEIFESNEDSTTYGLNLYSGGYSFELNATNVFGCSALISADIEVDTLVSLNIETLLEEPQCFDDSFILIGESNIEGILYEWKSFSGTVEYSIGVTDTLEVFSPATYTLSTPDVSSECQTADSFTLSDFLYPDYDDGYLELNPQGQIRCYGVQGGTYTWFIDDELIPSESGQSITPVDEGWYTCERTFNECSYVTDAYFWSPLSTTKNLDKELTIYPVPANRELFVEWKDETTENVNLTLVDIVGKMHEVNVRGFSDGFLQLDVSNLSAGVYILNMYVNNEQKGRRKLVIEH